MQTKPMSRWGRWAVLATVACWVSCKGQSQSSGGEPEMRPPEQIGAPAVAAAADPKSGGANEGQQYWRTKCVPCHAETGRGDGPDVITKKLTNKPGDLTNPDFNHSLSDDDIYNIVLYGGPGVGKSVDMPSYGDLQGRWDILQEIVKTIRGFAKK